MPRLTPEERAARAQRYAEAQAARAAKKLENKQRWLEDDARNANVRHKKMVEATAPEIAETTSGKSTEMLERIMNSPDTAVGLRIDSAEALLSYQQAPGSMALAETSAEAIAAGSAYIFLKQLSVTPGLAQPLQIKCLRLLANIEAIKARHTDPGQAAAQRSLLVSLANSARRREYIARGCWPQVCAAGPGWSLRADDTFVEPDLAASGPMQSISDALDSALARPAAEAAARREARRTALLQVEASSRIDRWRDLMTP